MADAQRSEELAFAYCLRRLTAAARSERDLRDKLTERGYEASVIDAVLERLRRAGYVDDGEYARMWVASRSRSKSLTAGVLRQELRRHGIDAELIEHALDQLDAQSEDDRARELIRRKATTVPAERAERDRLKRRLCAMLGRKGYPPGRAYTLVNEVLAEQTAR